MLNCKKATNKKLMIGVNKRFTVMAQFVKKSIENGELGEVYHIRTGWQRRAGSAPYEWFTNKSLSGGGCLIDLGVHFIDLAMYFLDYLKVRSITGKTYTKIINTEVGYLYNHGNQKIKED